MRAIEVIGAGTWGVRWALGSLMAAAIVALVLPPAEAKAPAKVAPTKTAALSPVEPAGPLNTIEQAPSKDVEREQALYKLLDTALAPVRDYVTAPEEITRLKDVAAGLNLGDLQKAKTAADQIREPTAAKLALWLRLRAGVGEAAEYTAFLAQNPAWPDTTLMRQRLEEALFTQGGSSRAIKSVFKESPPQTGIGIAALASANLAEGNEGAARELAAKAWRGFDIPATFEPGFLDRFSKLLTAADHKWRFDRLIMEDLRWATDRKERSDTARRVVPLLPEPERLKAEARLAVFLRSAEANAMMQALPTEAWTAQPTDWGLVYSRIDLFRKTGREEDAQQLLLGAPTDANLIVSPDGWWSLRRAQAFSALNAGKPKVAYDIARNAGQLSTNPAKDQAAFVGFLALRQLNNPQAAEGHFKALIKAADGPLSRARGEYWLARTYEALGTSGEARAHYVKAAQDVDTFHGQLALLKLNPGSHKLELPLPVAPTPAEQAQFASADAPRALMIARQAGLGAGITRGFLSHFQKVAATEGEAAMAAHLALALGDTQMSVRMGKAAIARGHHLYLYAYPVHALPAYRPLRPPPENAFLLGIGRQETEFNAATVSGAGARGLLQVMPVTANHVCSQHKLKCDINRLLTDNPYNVMMASAYIADRMSEFGGSYVLGIAGYNAGPGNARKWIGQFGDPRDKSVDAIDWMHRIPFEETRDYVQKVLSNIQVYRARLGAGERALMLDEDLARARGKTTAVPQAGAE